MTLRDYLEITVDSYTYLKIQAYDGEEFRDVATIEPHRWDSFYLPDVILDKKIYCVTPYYKEISVVLDYTEQCLYSTGIHK